MKKVTLIKGDGIGPEIAESVINIFHAIDVPVEFEEKFAGYEVYKKTGNQIPEDVYESIEKNGVVLKGPLTTPIGEGFRSINVHLRKKYNLFANIREVRSFKNTNGKYSDIDLVIFRENVEGLYIGEEDKRESKDDIITTAIKRISKSASMRILKEAFSHADKNKIDKVTIVHKANILKLTDGLFLECSREIQKEFSHIALEEIIIDNMCMQLVMNPQRFKIIATMNFYGDILSDLAAGLIGGLGLVPGANIGEKVSIFEAVHGSAPDIAKMNIANPTAFILSSINLLNYIGLNDYGNKILKGLQSVYDEGNHLTKDLGGNTTTTEFTKYLIEAMLGGK